MGFFFCFLHYEFVRHDALMNSIYDTGADKTRIIC